MAENTSILGKITKYLVIGGGIILFIFLAFLIIKWVPSLISGITNIGSSITETIGGSDDIKISANKSEVSSGEPLIISWKYTPKETGDYFIKYSCEDSLIFDIQSRSGPKRLVCGTEFKLGDNINSISLIPTLNKANTFVDSKVEISYKNIDKKQVAVGVNIVSIKNTSPVDNEFNTTTEDLPQTPAIESAPISTEPTNSTVSKNTNVPVQSNYTTYSSPADLEILNITNLGNSSLSFVVRNNGGRSSGNWIFSYTDAENPSQIRTSPIQASIAPNQSLLLTVRFNGQENNPQLIQINIDFINAILESNEFNNSASVLMTGSRTTNNTSNYGNFDRNDDADFVIDKMEVGRMSGSRFIEDDDIEEDDDAAIRFVVRNQGGETTDDWRFEIKNLPYDGNETFESKRQSPLRPGEKREIITEFENPDEGSYSIKVEVDSTDDTDEENERNNTETERLRVRN